ncbi:MAG: efflux RND transporter periplasmic adaptor subunit, partial [Pseudomonadota bacterium]
MTSHFISVAGLALLLAGCDAVPLPSEPEAEAPKPIRGLVTTLVQNTGDSTVRRYPGVLEPSEITSLSFEVAGRLGKIDLSVGQRIDEGTVLARLDSEQFEVTIENRKASVVEAEATVTQEADDLSRQEKLRESGTVSRVTVDNARADLKRAEAQLVQAQKNLASAEEDLTETVLQAPFSGIINSVDVDSFATVAVGTTVTSLYDASSYEVSFSVNFDTVSQMVVGTPATIRLADDPDVTLNAVISELGERADTVSSFPVTVALSEDHPLIKAGMAVEVSFEFQIPA